MSSIGVRALRTLRGLGSRSRVLLAAKTAVAAALAWWLAPFVPLAESEYSYYAPLGVLISMYPTFWDSARSGLQTLLGLGVGIALGLGALAAVHLGVSAILAMALTVAVGVILGGLQTLGPGRDWISFSALFVLLLGGSDASEFSFSYLATMGFGVLVGVLVQFVTGPPLRLGEASSQLGLLRSEVSASLLTLAEDLEREDRAGSETGFAIERLERVGRATSDEIREARASQRANPRARRRRGARQALEDRYRSLDHAVFFVRALADILQQRASRDPEDRPARDESLLEAVRACGELAGSEEGSGEREEQADRARRMLDAYFAAVDEAPDLTHSSIADDLAAGSYLARIIEVLR